jgi:hypothetical protein
MLDRRKAARAMLLASVLALMSAPVDADATAPIKLALFTFELDDFSAAVSADGETPADAAQLDKVTEEVRKLVAQSSRYQLVDVAGADAPEVKTHSLRDCNGCDARLALQLGAEQSFVGVVKRISRTEYQVRFQVRDARTGAVINEADTGLRMGALDSWNRGAVRLVKERLLKHPG